MKKLIPYIFLLLMCAGCIHSVDSRLARVSELADCGEIDSAAIVLQNIVADSLNEHNRRYYDLMSIKVRDKSYQDIKGDTVITELIRYFEDNGTQSEQAEAYYYGGRVYREMGDLPQSLDYFQKALDVLADDDSRIRLKGKTCSQMGQMFMSMYMFEQAKPKFQEAIAYQIACADSIGLMYNFCSLADTYKILNEPDSALFYYTKSLDLTQQINPNGIDEIETRVSIIEFYIRKKDYEKAISEYKYIEPYIYQNFITDYVTQAAININIISKDYTQVEKLSNKLLNSKNLNSREFAHSVLVDLYQLKNDTHKSYNHIIAYKKCIDSINSQTSREAVIHQNSFYNYSLREKENLNLREYKNRTKYIYVLSLLALTIIILGIAYFVTYRRKTRLAIHLKEEKIKKIESELQKIENLQTYEKIENKTIGNNIRAEYLKLIEIKAPYKNSLPEDIITSTIYNKLKTSAKSDNIRIEPEDWTELEKLVLTFYPKFKTTLVMLNSSISDYEYHICLLTKCQFSNKEISKLTYHSPSGVTSTRSRLFEKVFSVKGSASDMDYLINLL